MRVYEGEGVFPRVWTGPCPHADPTSRVVPAVDAPDWVLALVRGEVSNHDNGIGAGINTGSYLVLNGRAASWGPAWVPHGGRLSPSRMVWGYCCMTIGPEDRIGKVTVEVLGGGTPAFPLPRVVNFPGYGLAVAGPERTASQTGVTCRFRVTLTEPEEFLAEQDAQIRGFLESSYQQGSNPLPALRKRWGGDWKFCAKAQKVPPEGAFTYTPTNGENWRVFYTPAD